MLSSADLPQNFGVWSGVNISVLQISTHLSLSKSSCINMLSLLRGSSYMTSAFAPTPLPLNADVICERPLKVRSLLCEMVSNDKCTSLSTAQIRRVALFWESHPSHHHITLQMGFGSHGRLSRKPSLHSLSFRVPC